MISSSSKTVSVIIPVYNTESYLSHCLGSVLGQTYSDLQVICINDCSPDNSLVILSEYVQKDKRIKIINFQENRGVAAARNAGINAARGKYLGFVDADDYIDFDFYEKLIIRAQTMDADIMSACVRNFYLDGRCTLSKVVVNKWHYPPHHCSAIYRADFIRKNGITYPPLPTGQDCIFLTKAVVTANIRGEQLPIPTTTISDVEVQRLVEDMMISDCKQLQFSDAWLPMF